MASWAMTKTYTLVHVAPIPVGHTIELKLIAETTGIFQKEVRMNETEAVVTDLDSGITYACSDHVQTSFAISAAAQDPSELPMELRPDLKIGSVVRGRVVACHLYTLMAGSTWRVQTQITVESQ